MKTKRGILFSISEHIPAARWCLAMVVIAFTAAVSVRKYIDLADTASFSSFEVMFMTLTDVINIVFIYLPLYLFIVCGIMFDKGFGGLEILRCTGRREWLSGKLAAYIFNTVLFFGAVFIINFAVCSRVFPFSDVWSSHFVGFRIMMGQPSMDFAYPPVPTIAAACAAVLLLYIFCGAVNMLVSLITDRESTALFVSLFAGIALGLANMVLVSSGVLEQILRCIVLTVLTMIVYNISVHAVKKKDFGGKKLY
ncbi:MAG: hypothetical protein IJZ72_03660 [Oscillospiraceae bacterium]|nr:hypothetical protein [Oscillospiraceae bacterium]